MDTNNQMPVSDEAPAAPPVSIWSIIGNIFMAPSKAYEDFKAKPTILVPLILLIIMGSMIGGLQNEYNQKLQFDLLKTSTTLPPETLAQIEKQSQDESMLKVFLVAPIPIVIITVLIALLAWFIGGVIFGGKAKFMAIWGVGLLSGLISMLGGLVKTPLIMAKGSMYVSIGLAAIYPTKSFTVIMYSFLYYLDAFAIWAIIVAGIGYGIIFGISKGKGMAVSVITSLLFIFGMIGLTAFGLSFAGVEFSFF